jgi:hypothetical protein
LPLSRQALYAVVGDDTEPMLQSRSRAVTRLAHAAAEEARLHRLRLEFEDDLASWESFGSGEMGGAMSTDRQWELGIDRKALSEILDDYLLLLYLKDAERMSTELRMCSADLGHAPNVAIRPYPPDLHTREELTSRLQLLASSGVQDVMLYVNALMPQGTPQLLRTALDRIAAATH